MPPAPGRPILPRSRIRGATGSHAKIFHRIGRKGSSGLSHRARPLVRVHTVPNDTPTHVVVMSKIDGVSRAMANIRGC
ncbi:hypothetical protein H5410_032005 [Solanum commersonii]|uniref:Uncharacterized protein n=1 Tax=Solanum commersonii TaxID=4109 RepID=A0A9J5YIR3_SOLCO|nr:hypothetical protein H5410_032005 [Solanum commersonii]